MLGQFFKRGKSGLNFVLYLSKNVRLTQAKEH